MNFKIENGVTIISTGDAKGGKKNKNGHVGIYHHPKGNCYRADINHKRKKYHLGYSADIEELVAIRKEAELHVKHGDFVDWYNLRKGKRNGNRT